MRFKVGDKVLIREDLVDGEEYGSDDFVEGGMGKYRGGVYTISQRTLRGYHLAEDRNLFRYNWTDEMIERKVEE